jgi:hypothetical protein
VILTNRMVEVTNPEHFKNMGLSGKYFSERDLRLINHFNAELMGDVIQTEVTIYKIAANETKINVYGEADPATGIVFFPGIEITALIKREDISTEYGVFGSDRKQDVVFMFRENMLKLVNLFPENGDMIEFNNRWHEIDNVVQEQFLGGQPDKSHSIICNTHYSKLSKLNIINRQF